MTSSDPECPLQKQTRARTRSPTFMGALLFDLSFLAVDCSVSLPPSLSAVWGREERAETPHWPRWLAANQLQPKVIGSRWETFWWREQGEQVASWKEEGKKKENERKARGEWKRDSGVYAVQTSWESHSWALIPWTECGGMSRKEP